MDPEQDPNASSADMPRDDTDTVYKDAPVDYTPGAQGESGSGQKSGPTGTSAGTVEGNSDSAPKSGPTGSNPGMPAGNSG